MHAISKLSLSLAVALSFASMTPTFAATDASAPSATSDRDAASSLSEGEIKKVDKEAGKLTIKHGELKNLAMPAMTMVFRVKDLVMLESVKAGDRVNFVAEKIGGQFTVTSLETKQ